MKVAKFVLNIYKILQIIESYYMTPLIPALFNGDLK